MIKIKHILKEKFSKEEELTDISEDDYLIIEDETDLKRQFNTESFKESRKETMKHPPGISDVQKPWTTTMKHPPGIPDVQKPWTATMKHPPGIPDVQKPWTATMKLSVPDWFIRLMPRGKMFFGRKSFLILAVLFLILLFLSYIYFHVGETYSVISSSKRNDISGTTYLEYGKNLLKYSSDGVSCVNYSGDILWSTTFSMQTPIADICENAAVVADQKGTQIYIFNETGLIGKFQTLLLIEKVKVAEQGVVLAVLEDGDTTWINLYDTEGNEIAKNRTTISESGYPLDIALSPDGLKSMVSYLYAMEGDMNTKVAFYNFDMVGQSEMNNLVNSETYKNEVVPKVIFLDEGTSIAFRSDGFSIFKGRQIPEEKANIVFEEEILSIFYNKSYLGFVFESTDPDHKYKIHLYDTNGKKTLEKYIDYNYKQMRISNNQIILFNDREIVVYSINGHLKFKGNYAKPVTDVIGVNGLRKYFVLTSDSTDLIRLK